MRHPFREAIHALLPEVIDIRRHLHRNPELSNRETETARFVAERLREMGLEARAGIGGNGVVADLRGSATGKTIALRADMDALPIQEQNAVDYCSQNPGVMHACGHDGHTSILLGTAKALLARREELPGNIRFIFQPAEETVDGAKRLCEEGVMEGVDAVIGLHGWPDMETGQIGIRPGAMMASADAFDLIIRGQGSHAAYPHISVDPILVGAQMVQAFQSIASREIAPQEPVVVSVTQFHAGTAYNVISGEARLHGTARALSPAVREEIPARLKRIAEGICAAARATCELNYIRGTAPVLNDAGVTALISDVGAELLGRENVLSIPYSSMGAEDFSEYLNHAPGAMFRLGLGEVAPLHTPTFNFNEDALPVGIEMFAEIAFRFLSEKQG